MQLCHQTIVRSCGVRGCELIRPLMSKRSEGENLRLIEFSLFESRDVFRMIANLYAHLGLGVEDLQELLERISANYFRLTRFSQGIYLCTEPLKIKFFVREVLEQLLCVPEVCAYLKACRPRRSFSGLMEKQVLLHRAYMLVIPRAMQTAIDRNNMSVSVIGFQPDRTPLTSSPS